MYFLTDFVWTHLIDIAELKALLQYFYRIGIVACELAIGL